MSLLLTRELGDDPIMSRKLRILVLLVISLVPFVVDRSYAGGQLSVTVSTDKQSYDPGETVLIAGKVLDESLEGVAFASVSIQVNDPSGNPIHVGWVLSTADGSYADQFIARADSMNGGYSIYVTASKPGYTDGNSQVGCIITPEFPVSDISLLMFLVTLFLAVFARRRKQG